MLQKIKNVPKYLNLHSEGHEDLETPKDIHAEFQLKYKSLTVGTG